MKHKRKILLWTCAIIALLALAGIIAASFYMIDYALAPCKRTKQEAIERFYKREPEALKNWVDSLENNNALHDTSIIIEDRGKMKALFIKADTATSKTAILVHGYKDRAESMLHIAYIYNHDMGYNVVLPHLHGHGDSEGDHIGMGWLDSKDVIEWVTTASSMFGNSPSNSQIVLHGISMGAATVMCVSGNTCPNAIKCFVEDCGYTSVWDEFASELHNQFDLPDFPLMYTTSALCKLRYGWSFGEASALNQVKKSTLPMLFIHGDADTFVPYPMLDKLYNAKQHGYKEKYVARGSEHARSFTDHQEEYTLRVKNFVNKFIK